MITAQRLEQMLTWPSAGPPEIFELVAEVRRLQKLSQTRLRQIRQSRHRVADLVVANMELSHDRRDRRWS